MSAYDAGTHTRRVDDNLCSAGIALTKRELEHSRSRRDDEETNQKGILFDAHKPMTQLSESPHRYTTRRPGDRRPVPSRLRLRSIRQPARLRLSSVARRDVPWIALRPQWTERSRDRRILYFRILSQSFGYWYSFNALTGELSAKGCRELFRGGLGDVHRR